MPIRNLTLLLLFLLPLGACGGPEGPEILIYTSIYPDVYRSIQPQLEARFPDVRFRWYQKGSEQIALRLGAELEAGTTDCDLLLTSDPFYYAELRDAGHLLPYETDATHAVPAALKDPGHHFATVRIPVMVIGARADVPVRSFQDLADAAYAGTVTMGNPLQSGTNFTTVAALSKQYGWAFYETLRSHDVMAAGGNSAVLRRLESGERRVGVILLENLLPRTIEKDYPVRVVYPEDGAIPIPSPAAILKQTAEPELAKAVFDFLFSDAVQRVIVAGHMYSPLPDQAPPAGAPPLDELKLFPWTQGFMEEVRTERIAIKKRWREIMR